MGYRINYGRPTRQFYLLVTIIAIIIAVIAGWFLWRSANTTDGMVDRSKYQAVFLTNGQVYFGKLTGTDSEYLRLSDVYYFQTGSEASKSDDSQKSADKSNDVKLIKLESALHGPEDQMIILKGQVLFFENIKDEGSVVKLIKDMKSVDKPAS